MRRDWVLLVALLALAGGCATAVPGGASRPTPPAGRSVAYEVSGAGTAYTIDYGPDATGGAVRVSSPELPWRTQVPDPGAEIYQVVVVGGQDVGCRIVLDGKVVADEREGGHCVYRP